MKNFKNKIVVITGAASGMGKAYALEFAKLGSKLALCDVDKNGLLEVEKQCGIILNKDTIYSEIVDVSDKKAVFNFAENVKNNFGNAHVIINNAGIEGFNMSFYNGKLQDFERLMNVNFYGVVYISKAFLPQLVANNEGALVNVSSVFGMIGPPGFSDYSASKFAVRGFTESLMIEFYKSPISIHSLHPGGINTNIIRDKKQQIFAKKELITSPEKIVKHVVKCIQKKKPKIVYGNNAFKVWFGANFIPKKWFLPLLFKDMKKNINKEDYKNFNQNLSNKL